MSSLRNSVQRRAHRERAQPLERQRLGLLEKKKDYQKRSKDYNKKKAVIKSLREKASERNEDEFYFGMMSRRGPGASITQGKRFTGAVENDRGNKAMDIDMVRLLKTQDLGYIRTLRNVAAKEARELEERFILAGGTEQGDMDYDDDDDDDEDDDEDNNTPSHSSRNAKPKKIVFCDGEEERNQALEKQPGGDEDDPMWEDNEEDEKKIREATRKAINLEKLQKRLRSARKKLRTLASAEYELELTQAKMAKTATSGGITKNGQRIKIRERKR